MNEELTKLQFMQMYILGRSHAAQYAPEEFEFAVDAEMNWEYMMHACFPESQQAPTNTQL